MNLETFMPPFVKVVDQTAMQNWLARDLAMPYDTAQHRAAVVFRAMLDEAIRKQEQGKR